MRLVFAETVTITDSPFGYRLPIQHFCYLAFPITVPCASDHLGRKKEEMLDREGGYGLQRQRLECCMYKQGMLVVARSDSGLGRGTEQPISWNLRREPAPLRPGPQTSALQESGRTHFCLKSPVILTLLNLQTTFSLRRFSYELWVLPRIVE